MDIIQVLAKIGLPSAIVAMVIIAFLFKDQFEKWAKIAIIIAIVLAAMIGAIQVYQLFTGKDISVIFEPDEYFAISRNGSPIETQVIVKQGGKIIATKTRAALDSNHFATRPFTLQQVLPNSKNYELYYEGNQQGILTSYELQKMGWIMSGENKTSGTPRYWFTHKVFIGQTHNLGDTGKYGELLITFDKIKENKAIVFLSLSGRGKPIPAKIAIENKQVGHQDFVEIPTLYIAVREADFRENEDNPKPWAAFSVFLID